MGWELPTPAPGRCQTAAAPLPPLPPRALLLLLLTLLTPVSLLAGLSKSSGGTWKTSGQRRCVGLRRAGQARIGLLVAGRCKPTGEPARQSSRTLTCSPAKSPANAILPGVVREAIELGVKLLRAADRRGRTPVQAVLLSPPPPLRCVAAC